MVDKGKYSSVSEAVREAVSQMLGDDPVPLNLLVELWAYERLAKSKGGIVRLSASSFIKWARSRGFHVKAIPPVFKTVGEVLSKMGFVKKRHKYFLYSFKLSPNPS